MRKHIAKITGILTAILMLAGCVVNINIGKPTADEQTLMDIQSQVNQEISRLSQKMQGGNFSVEQLQGLITEVKKVVDENLKKIEGLKLPERARDLANKTKDYLKQAEQTYENLLQMSKKANTKVQELMSNLQIMSQPLVNMAGQIEQMKKQFLDELQKATGGLSQQS